MQFMLNTHVHVNHKVNQSNFFLRVKVLIRMEYYSKNPVCMSKYKQQQLTKPAIGVDNLFNFLIMPGLILLISLEKEKQNKKSQQTITLCVSCQFMAFFTSDHLASVYKAIQCPVKNTNSSLWKQTSVKSLQVSLVL